jgi:hypothetical protein
MIKTQHGNAGLKECRLVVFTRTFKVRLLVRKRTRKGGDYHGWVCQSAANCLGGEREGRNAQQSSSIRASFLETVEINRIRRVR